MADAALARRAIRLLDLTDLSDDASEAGLEQLCQRALMPPGPVAAICIWPRFVARMRRSTSFSAGTCLRDLKACDRRFALNSV